MCARKVILQYHQSCNEPWVDVPIEYVSGKGSTHLPDHLGMFCQWNHNTGWSASNPMVASDGSIIWDATNSTDLANCLTNSRPAGWRLPTYPELQILDVIVNTVGFTVPNSSWGIYNNDCTNTNGIFTAGLDERGDPNSLFFLSPATVTT